MASSSRDDQRGQSQQRDKTTTRSPPVNLSLDTSSTSLASSSSPLTASSAATATTSGSTATVTASANSPSMMTESPTAQGEGQEAPQISESPSDAGPPSESAAGGFMLSESPSASPVEDKTQVERTSSRDKKQAEMRDALAKLGLTGGSHAADEDTTENAKKADEATGQEADSTPSAMCESPIGGDDDEDGKSSAAHSFSQIQEKGLASQAISEGSTDSLGVVPFLKSVAGSRSTEAGATNTHGKDSESEKTDDNPASSSSSGVGPREGGDSKGVSSSTARTATRQVSQASQSSTHSRTHPYKETLDAHSKDLGDGSRIINQYKIMEMIGQGAYGTVHRAVLVDNPEEEFAVKEFSKTRLRKTHRATSMSRRPDPRSRGRGRGRGRGFGLAQRERSSHEVGAEYRNQDVMVPEGLEKEGNEEKKDPLHLIRHELAILKKLDHPHVVKLYEVLDDPAGDSLYMVFENCPGGRVIDMRLHEQVEPLKEEDAGEYLRQIALGIEYLHHNEIVHRDIKPDNILLTRDKTSCRIVDFGVSEMFVKPGDDRLRKSAGSPAYMSPELCTAGHGDYHGRADDMWSLGVTLYCMVVGRLPFDQDQFLELYRSIREDEPEYPSHLSEDLVDILKRLLRKNPDERMTVDELREHPWVKQHGKHPMPSKEENLADVVEEITEEDVEKAIVRAGSIFTVVRAIGKFKKRASSRRTASAGSASTGSEAGPAPSGEKGAGAGGWFGNLVSGASSAPSMALSHSQSSLKEVAESVGKMLAPQEEPGEEGEEDDGEQVEEKQVPMPGRFTMSPSTSAADGLISRTDKDGRRQGSVASDFELNPVAEGGRDRASHDENEASWHPVADVAKPTRPQTLGAQGRKESSVSSSAGGVSMSTATSSSGNSHLDAAASSVTAALERFSTTSTATSMTSAGSATGSDRVFSSAETLTTALGHSTQPSSSSRSSWDASQMTQNIHQISKGLEAAGNKIAKNVWQEIHPLHRGAGRSEKTREGEAEGPDAGVEEERVVQDEGQEGEAENKPTVMREGSARAPAPGPIALPDRDADSAAHQQAQSTVADANDDSRAGQSVAAKARMAGGRPRLLDGPLVESPKISRIKTPDDASEFYKGMLPKREDAEGK